MKLTFEQILNSKDVLNKLGTQTMTSVNAYRIQKNIRLLNPEMDAFQKELNNLVEKYQIVKEDGTKEFPEEKKEEYLKELNELLREEIDIEIRQIPIDELKCEITPFDLMRIDWMIV